MTSTNGTFRIAAPARVGRMFMTAPMSRPPALPLDDRDAPPTCTARAIRSSADRDEVGERVRLLHHPAGVVPGLAELAAAAHVRQRARRRPGRGATAGSSENMTGEGIAVRQPYPMQVHRAVPSRCVDPCRASDIGTRRPVGRGRVRAVDVAGRGRSPEHLEPLHRASRSRVVMS